MKPVIIPSNSEVTINGYTDKTFPCIKTIALIQGTKKSVIPKDLDVISKLIDYKYESREPLMVAISNVTTRTVKISPKAVIAELQFVTLKEFPGLSSQDTAEPTSFNIPEDTLTNEYFATANQIISKNGGIFAWGDTDNDHVAKIKHRIKLWTLHHLSSDADAFPYPCSRRLEITYSSKWRQGS
jgi:hypothetical protein